MKIGPTGKFPDGKLDKTDDGELTFAISHDRYGNVRLDFGTPTAWLALPRAQAIDLAKMIMVHAGAKLVHLETFDLPKDDPLQ